MEILVIYLLTKHLATIQDLANSIINLSSNSKSKIQIIGTRHGEKQYETLCTREEMEKAEDMGDFRIPSDNRDLNYSSYFSKGKKYKSNRGL